MKSDDDRKRHAQTELEADGERGDRDPDRQTNKDIKEACGGEGSGGVVVRGVGELW